MIGLSGLWFELFDDPGRTLSDWGGPIITFGLPCWFIILPVIFRRRNGLPCMSARCGFWCSLILGWIALVMWRLSFVDVWIKLQSVLTLDEFADRVTGNQAVLLFGWLAMLIGCIPALTLRAIIQKLWSCYRLGKPLN